MSDLIKPKQQGDQLLIDIQLDPDPFKVWWLGQSGYLLQWRDRHLLFDPYLSDSLTTKYAQTDKPHVRMTELAIEPSKLDFVDVVTSSHNHTDHLDGPTLNPLFDVNPKMKLVIPDANKAFAAKRLDISPLRMVGLDDGVTTEVDGFEFTGIAAAHEELGRDDQHRCIYLGFVVKFGRWTVYHSGDTLLYDGMVERLKPHQVDLAFLPINGRKPERRVAGNLNGEQAAKLAKDIGAKLVTPCHYEMFEFNTESPDLFIKTCEELDQPYRVLECGERLDSIDIPD